MLGWCKAHLHRDAKMQALGLTLRDESGKGEGVYYDGKGGLPWGQELGSLIGISLQKGAPLARQEKMDPFWWWVQARSSVPDALASDGLGLGGESLFCSFSELLEKGVDMLLLLGGAELPAGADVPAIWSLEAATPQQVDEFTVSVVLRQLLPEAKLLACSHVSMEPSSVRLGTNRRLWKAAGLIPAALDHRKRTGELPAPLESPEPPSLSDWEAGQKDGAGGAFPAILRRLNQKLRSVKQWSIGLHPGQASPENLSAFVHLESPRGLHWADPFLVEQDGRSFLFLEEVSTSRLLGRISVAEVDENGMKDEPRPIIVEDFHS